MELGVMWSLAETAYSLLAIAALSVAWCIWQRASRSWPTVFLCTSLGILAVYYGCVAVDAFVHASQATARPFTVWSAFGQIALALCGTLFVTFLLFVVGHLSAPARPPRWVVVGLFAHVACGCLVAAWLGSALGFALLGGAETDVIDRAVDGIVTPPGAVLLTALTFTAPFGLLCLLFAPVPTPSRPRWIGWLARAGQWQETTTPDATVAEHRQPPATTRTFRVLSVGFFVVAWVASKPSFPVSPIWTVESLGVAILLRMLLLPSLLAVVYYHAPFLFFDVLVKRGVVWTALTLLVTLPGLAVASLLLPDQVAFVAAACAGITVLLMVSVSLVDWGSRWLDRLLFHRPNYRAELAAITAVLARCPDSAALTTALTTQLAQALRAEYVRYGPDISDPSLVVVGLGSPNRPRGYLALGPRTRGQPYGSEDVTFVEAVAAQFAAHLEALDAQASAMRALRAQINPHFLFNSLSTLAEMAHGEPATERAILNLSQVFRYALDSTHQERVPLGAEVDAVRAYLEIEAERFAEQVRFEITVPNDLRDVPVPPMLLQPLVENAVTHGLASTTHGGTVRILAMRENGHVRLTVQDTGVGFDPDQTPRRVGLANVAARVERSGGSWRVHSTPGVGTEITLTLVA